MYIFLSKIHYHMVDLTYILEKLVLIVFFICNASIIWQDISHRKIKNIQLLYLLLLLPLWIYVYDISSGELINHMIISWLLLLWGIIFYRQDGFIWAWDFKYAAILILFATNISLSTIVWNIGIITILSLIIWLGYILKKILSTKDIDRYKKVRELYTHISVQRISQVIVSFIVTWFMLWWIIYEVFQWFLKFISEFGIIKSWDIYLLIMIFIFLMRQHIQHVFFYWKHWIYPILGIIIYVGYKMNMYGPDWVVKEWIHYIENIWIYWLIIMTLHGITKLIFSIYDTLSENNSWEKHTIPYSLILFLGFMIWLMGNISLLWIIYDIFL